MTLRRFLFIQTQQAIAHTFNSDLGYEEDLSKDKSGLQTREIQRGRAYSFDGVNDYIDTGLSPLGRSELTMSLYFGSGAGNATKGICLARPSSTPIVSGIFVNGGGTVGFYLHAGGVLRSFSFGVSANDGIWRKYTATYDGSLVKLYVNDVLVSSGPATGNITGGGNFLLGSDVLINGRYVRGSSHSLIIGDVAASQSEIENNSYPKLLYYKGDEGSGTIAYDSSGNGNHGTLINGVQHITLTDGNGADFQNKVGYNSSIIFSNNRLYERENFCPANTFIGLRFSVPVVNIANILFEYSIGSQRFGFFVLNNRFGIAGGTVYKTSNQLVEPNRHYHVFVDLFSYTLYVDNVPLTFGGNISTSSASIGDTFRIGGSTVTGFLGTGTIYDVQVYDVVKNSAERASIINGVEDNVGILARYIGNDTVDDTMSDSSGNNRSLTATNLDFEQRFYPRDEINQNFDVYGYRLQQASKVKYDAQLWGRYYSFDGVNDYVQVPHDASLTLQNDLTVCGWMQFPGPGSTYQGFAITKWKGGGNNIGQNERIVGIPHLNSQTIRFVIETTDGFFRADTTSVAQYYGKWTHICGVKTSSHVLLYINGLLITSTPYTGSPVIGNNTVHIGRQNYSVPYHTDMDAYDIRLYNTAKSLSDIQSIMNGVRDIVGLQMQLKMDEGAGTTAYDSSGNGNHGTLINGVSHGTEQGQGSIYRQSLGHSLVGGVAVPRNESNPTQDVLGNSLQYVGDNQSLLPGGRVNFDTAPAPELIRLGVDQDYTHGDTLPASMTKTVDTYKEKDFIVSDI